MSRVNRGAQVESARGSARGRRCGLTVVVMALTLPGCTRDVAPAATTASAPVQAGADTHASPAPSVAERDSRTDTVMARALQWDVAAVQGRLASDTLVATVVGPVAERFMHVPGVLLRVQPRRDPQATAELEVFVYGDAGTRGGDTDALDPVRILPANASAHWRAPVSLVTANNLAAIVLSSDATLRRRITDALVAGHGGPHRSGLAEPGQDVGSGPTRHR